MSGRKYDVIVFDSGAVFLDLIFQGLPEFPRLGEEMFASKLAIEPGGAANISIALARLGVKTALVAQTGTDLFSSFLEERLKREKVDTSHMMRKDKDARAITVSLTYPEDRAFVSYVDEACDYGFPENLFRRGKANCLFLTSMYKEQAVFQIIEKAKSCGMKVAMDPHLPWGSIEEESVRKLLSSVDLLLPNSLEAKKLADTDNVRSALGRLEKITDVVIKDGSKGALASVAKERLRIGTSKVKVVDTTGAGDCFNAGFVSGWIKGVPLADCVARGNACGSFSVQHAGGATGAPTETQLKIALE